MNWKKLILYNFVCWCEDFKESGNILELFKLDDKYIYEYIEEFVQCILEDEYGDWEEVYKTYNITANDIKKYLHQTLLEED